MRNTMLKISGTINKGSYLSLEKYILSARYKIIYWCVVLLLDAAFLFLTFCQHDLVWLIFPVLLTLGAFAFFRWNRRNVVNRVIASTPGIREGKSFDLDLSFDEDAVRVHNRATGLDTALSYELFSSYADTKDVIALFVKTGTYLLIPGSNLDQETRKAVINLMSGKCKGLHERKF